MATIFTYEEGSILLRMLIAHFIVDFFLQTDAGVQQKNNKSYRSPYLWWHVALVMLVTWLLLWDISYWKQIFLIGVSHALIDTGKILLSKKYKNSIINSKLNLWLFIADQVLHVLVIAAVWIWIINGWDQIRQFIRDLLIGFRLQAYVLAYIIAVGPVSYLVRFLTDKWATDLEKSEVGLKNAGMWIGFLERTLILTLVFIQQYTAIGFLVAAKSILRLIDKPEPPKVNTKPEALFNSRKHTEYVLIGTFLSFGFALLIGLISNWLLQL